MIKLKDLLEQGAGDEAKKRGLQSIGFGRYVDPANPNTVVAKSQNGKLVLVKGGEQKGSAEPSRKDKPAEAPAKQEPEHVTATTASGEKFRTTKAALKNKRVVSKLAKSDKGERTAKDFKEPVYMRIRRGQRGVGSGGKWVKIRGAEAQQDGTIRLDGPSDSMHIFVDGRANQHIDLAKKSVTGTDEFRSPKGMPIGAQHATSLFYPDVKWN